MIFCKDYSMRLNFAYRSLECAILEYGAAWWDSYCECQTSALDRVQNKSAQFAQRSGGSDWESLAQRRKISSMCALYKASTGESALKAIGDSLQAPSYLCRVDQYLKIRARKKEEFGNSPLWMGPLLTGQSYLKGRYLLPTVKRIFPKPGLGNRKLVRGSEGDKNKELTWS